MAMVCFSVIFEREPPCARGPRRVAWHGHGADGAKDAPRLMPGPLDGSQMMEIVERVQPASILTSAADRWSSWTRYAASLVGELVVNHAVHNKRLQLRAR